eukprot:CAMPEP_0205999212 /NCGR_PEP_ID=MMETSP1464-20131121/711_1 /ASSEMBLY_ACC=CAM_ASM_001124 /TAXON_ID=119497 /ORGANISM="Exanthemachrysis gayraliae, Strain RCC1523" /LENGTH=315 /DNA_ID=CAMNT_0053372397 /DNA_START=1 /DNA_END=948 /DNA_ORIENTATION=-
MPATMLIARALVVISCLLSGAGGVHRASQATRSAIAVTRRNTALGIASVPLVAEIWARWPINSTLLPPVPSLGGLRDAVILFGGMDFYDTPVTERTYSRFNTEERIRESDRAAGVRRLVHEYDWRSVLEHRGDKSFLATTDEYVRTSHGGQQIGRYVGRELAKAPGLRSLHVIGASVGAFPADACAAAYVNAKRGDPDRAHVRLTLLDPLILRGVFETGYGAANFGRTVDYAEAYLNTDDQVPSTNEELANAFTYNITGCAERRKFEGEDELHNNHAWPTAYFAYHYQTKVMKNGELVLPQHDAEHPRGGVVDVP